MIKLRRKPFFILFLTLIVVCGLLFFLKSSHVKIASKEESKKSETSQVSKKDELSLEERKALADKERQEELDTIKTLENTPLKDRLEGLWVNEEEDYQKIEFTFIDEDTAVMDYERSGKGCPNGVGSKQEITFRKISTNFEEGMHNSYYESTFQINENNYYYGIGHILVDEDTVTFTYKRAPFGFWCEYHQPSAEYSRPVAPDLKNALEEIEKEVSMNENGFVPKKTVTYHYKGANGLGKSERKYSYKIGKTVYLDPYVPYGGTNEDVQYEETLYGINRKGIYLDDKNDYILQFPLKKGNAWVQKELESWKEEKSYFEINYSIVEDDFTLNKTLKDVIIVQQTIGDYIDYYYYHKKYGLVAFSNNYADKNYKHPKYILDDITVEKEKE